MGGYGSGRSGHKQKAEHTKSLDVNRLHREGCLSPGKRGHCVWTRNGEEFGRIDCNGIVNGRHCLRRVGKVFAGGRYFLCRHCYNVAYASQSEPRYDRMLRRANKLRTALGGEAGTANWIAPKPKGMWQRTYQRKRFEIEWCENQANHHFLSKFAHLLSTEEREMFFGR